VEGTRSASRTRGKYEGCDGWAWAQGYCDPHYQRLKHEGVIQVQRIFNDPVKRFESEFDKNPDHGCWERSPEHERAATKWARHRFCN
jgi:hypothetical protein